MKVLVTGVAGFIGSHLAESLVSRGHTVVGIDSFEDYYPRWIKETNLQPLLRHKRFHMVEDNLVTADLSALLKGVDVVYHLAGQAGVRQSWGQYFETYVQNNIMATHRLLEAALRIGTGRIVYASTSSVYGQSSSLPLKEEQRCRPFSPYGVTKLAAENLCMLYTSNYGLPTVALRYFTVYGARQRPDMGFHRFIRSALAGQPIVVYGDGLQTRDFTHVSDIVEATQAAAEAPPGTICNVGGGSRVTLLEALDTLSEAVGVPVRIEYAPRQNGDVTHTWADLSQAQKYLNYAPKVDLLSGLREEVAWIKALYQG